MSDNVWDAGSEDAPGAEGLGAPDYENGAYANSAFSINTIFRLGFAALKEQPVLILLAGFNLWLIAMIPQLFQAPVDVWVAVMVETGELDEDIGNALSSLVQLAIGFMFWPISMLVAAGCMVSVGRFVKSDEISIGALYTSFQPAVKALLYSLVAFVVGAIAAIVLLGVPMGVGAGIGFAAGSPESAILLLAVGALIGFLPLIYVTLGLQLGPYAAVMDGLGPVEALRVSWEAADGARVTLFITNLLLGILELIATCLCCFPAIPVIAIRIAGFSAAWMLYARHEDETETYPFFERNGAF